MNPHRNVSVTKHCFGTIFGRLLHFMFMHLCSASQWYTWPVRWTNCLQCPDLMDIAGGSDTKAQSGIQCVITKKERKKRNIVIIITVSRRITEIHVFLMLYRLASRKKLHVFIFCTHFEFCILSHYFNPNTVTSLLHSIIIPMISIFWKRW